MSYLITHSPRVVGLLGEHLYLVLLTMSCACLIALPLGFFLARRPWLAGAVLGFLGVIYTIPSIAFFALLIPWFGLGRVSALIALVAYTQMILVRNVVTALWGINPAVKEAARGMGMSGGQILWRIELPLALPVIVSGLRIAVVTVVGIASVAAFINAGGLGVLLFEGIRTDHGGKIVSGTIALALLAVSADLLFRCWERVLRRRPRA